MDELGPRGTDDETKERDVSPTHAARLAAIIESSDDAIVSKDLNGIVTSWNQAAERMFGYTSDEMLGRSIRRIIPEDRQAEEDEVLARIRRGERVDHFETIRRRKDGTLVPISLSVSPMRDANGRVIGASKIGRDIGERVRLQSEAREQAAISRRLAEVGAALAATLDRETIVRRVTEAATALTAAEICKFWSVPGADASPAAIPANGSSGVLEALTEEPLGALLARTFRGESVVRIDDVTSGLPAGQDLALADTPARHVAIRSYLAVSVKTGTGDVLGGLFLGHSRPGVFTEQHERLAVGLAAWASVALQNAYLYIEARTANRMKDEFLAVLSHELRTPLNAIVGYARLLRTGILQGEKADRGLETLERNAGVLTQIVEDVLDVSRIVAGKIRLNVQPLELPLIVHNAVATVQHAADAKGVRIETVFDRQLGPVSGDPDRLQQVVWNLLSNAVKFTAKGGRVQLRLERADGFAQIVVSDTGIGISPEFLPHVFERFRQGDASITRRAGGLGLGLAIVRHIVEMHGGTVHASSPGIGQGATFRIQVPLSMVYPEELNGRRDPRSDRLDTFSASGQLKGIRVLAVDDEPDALALVRVVLEAAGAEVVTVPSASLALERIQTVHPHAVIVDLGMPEMDGFELIARIRASADADVRDVPATALTAFARPEDRTRALRSGFEMHLAKPVDPGELVASVGTLVRRSHRGSSR